MRPRFPALLWVGGALCLIALALAAMASGPRPILEEIVDVRAAGDAGALWRLHAAIPEEMLAGGRGRVSLRLEAVSPAAQTPRAALLARLVGPGLRVEPSGDQLSPVVDDVRFSWTVFAGARGSFSLSPTLALRSASQHGAADAATVVWAKAFDLRVRSPLGLTEPVLRFSSAGFAAVGAGLLAARWWERRRWRSRRQD